MTTSPLLKATVSPLKIPRIPLPIQIAAPPLPRIQATRSYPFVRRGTRAYALLLLCLPPIRTLVADETWAQNLFFALPSRQVAARPSWARSEQTVSTRTAYLVPARTLIGPTWTFLLLSIPVIDERTE